MNAAEVSVCIGFGASLNVTDTLLFQFSIQREMLLLELSQSAWDLAPV